MVAKDFFEVLISYEFFSMTFLKVARKSIGERVKLAIIVIKTVLLLRMAEKKNAKSGKMKIWFLL